MSGERAHHLYAQLAGAHGDRAPERALDLVAGDDPSDGEPAERGDRQRLDFLAA